MKLLEMVNDEPVVSTITIAYHCKADHRSVKRHVDNHKSRLKKMANGVLRTEFAKRHPGESGRPTSQYLLNEKQALWVVTSMRNNEIVADFREALIDAFISMRDCLRSGILATVQPKTNFAKFKELQARIQSGQVIIMSDANIVLREIKVLDEMMTDWGKQGAEAKKIRKELKGTLTEVKSKVQLCLELSLPKSQR